MNSKLLFYKDNFEFEWGDHDVAKWTNQILKKNFEVQNFEKDAKGEKIVFFDDFTKQKHVDELKNLSRDNKIILVVTEYFTKFKNFYSLNYFENRKLSLHLTKIAFFTNLINILISILRLFVFDLDKKKLFKITFIFLFGNLYVLFFLIYFLDLLLEVVLDKIFLLVLTTFILIFVFLLLIKLF